jgi:hypothetical protein
MHVLGVMYLMKHSGLLGLAAWCLCSWWCALWVMNKLPLSNVLSFSRYAATMDLLALAGTRR